jgi:ribonuclease J
VEDFQFNVKLFLDFGVNMKLYYDTYKKGKEPSSLGELISNKLLPEEELTPLKNLYQKSATDDGPSNLDAVLISHPHKDHYAGLAFLNRSIPVHAGVDTKKIIIALSEASRDSIMNDFTRIHWQEFRTGKVLKCKKMIIVPYHVDHSIPAAYGFVIYSSAGPIVYSGDLRMHGPLSYMTSEFEEEIKMHKTFKNLDEISKTEKEKVLPNDDIAVLICEGTHIHKGMIESEDMVEKNLNILFKNNPFDFILVKYDQVDWDRFRTFSHLARKYDWKYIIGEREAYFYYLLNKDAIHETMRDPDVITDDHIFIIKNGTVKHRWQEKVRQYIYKRGQGSRFITYRDLKKLDGKFFLYITHLHEQILNNLNYNLRGLFISSSIDPYAEEFLENSGSIAGTLREFGIPSYRVQASGHAPAHDLINFIERISPKVLIPIHTEYPSMFKKLFKNCGIRVVSPIINNPIDL